MRKTMNFIYYRPVRFHSDQGVILDKYFEKIASDPDKYATSLSASLKDIQLHQIKYHSEYLLSSGVVHKTPLWELSFLHTRIDVPAIVDESTNTIRAVKVSTEQKIAEITVLVYDPIKNIVIINRTQSGVSYTKIAEFINFFVDDNDDKIKFSILTNEKIVESIKKKTTITSISTRLITTATHDIDSCFDNIKNPSLLSIIKTHNTLKTPKEYPATISYELHVNAKQKKASLDVDSMYAFIDDIFKLVPFGFIKKCVVKARDSNDLPLKQYDLLEYIIKDIHEFSITSTNRYISEATIMNAIVLEYHTNKRV